MASFEFKQRQTQRDLIEKAIGQLSGRQIGLQFESMKDLFGPEFEAMMRDAALSAQTNEQSIMAELGRAGIQGGPGMALAAGARAGTMHAAQTTRAQLISKLLDNALAAQTSKAQGVFANAGQVFNQQNPGGIADKALGAATFALPGAGKLLPGAIRGIKGLFSSGDNTFDSGQQDFFKSFNPIGL
jgi:hypothetical protein